MDRASGKSMGAAEPIGVRAGLSTMLLGLQNP